MIQFRNSFILLCCLCIGTCASEPSWIEIAVADAWLESGIPASDLSSIMRSLFDSTFSPSSFVKMIQSSEQDEYLIEIMRNEHNINGLTTRALDAITQAYFEILLSYVSVCEDSKFCQFMNRKVGPEWNRVCSMSRAYYKWCAILGEKALYALEAQLAAQYNKPRCNACKTVLAMVSLALVCQGGAYYYTNDAVSALDSVYMVRDYWFKIAGEGCRALHIDGPCTKNIGGDPLCHACASLQDGSATVTRFIVGILRGYKQFVENARDNALSFIQ